MESFFFLYCFFLIHGGKSVWYSASMPIASCTILKTTTILAIFICIYNLIFIHNISSTLPASFDKVKVRL